MNLISIRKSGDLQLLYCFVLVCWGLVLRMPLLMREIDCPSLKSNKVSRLLNVR